MTPAPAEFPVDPALRRRGRRIMLLVLAICAAPIILGTFAYYFWRPSGQTNFGELLAPARLTLAALLPDGKALDIERFGGKWVLVVVDSVQCDNRCQRKLFAIRQFRAAQGRDQERVERLWLVQGEGAVSTALDPLTTGATLARVVRAEDIGSAFGGDPEHFLFLVDPQGNLMMRFAADAEPKRVMKDIEKLLRLNKRGI